MTKPVDVHRLDTGRGLGQGVPDGWEAKHETWLSAIARGRHR
jgi:hypothetical protein